MFSRGRGKPFEWSQYKFSFGPKLPEPGVICVGPKKSIRIVTSGGRRRGYRVIVESKSHESNVTKCFDAANCTLLLNDGVFSTPTNARQNFGDMPDRVLLKMFAHIGDVKTLTRCERVCRRWKGILASAALSSSRDAGVSAFGRFKKVFVTQLKFIVDDKAVDLECKFQANVSPSSKNVHNNDGECDFSSVTFMLPKLYVNPTYLASTVSKIFDKFSVRKLSFVDLEISETLLGLLVVKQKRLSQLRFLRCLIDENSLATLTSIRGLKELAVDSCYGVGESISRKSLLPLLQQNVLHSFELSGAVALPAVDDAVLDGLLSTWRHNRFDFLKLGNCPNLSTRAIAKVVTHYIRPITERRQLVVFLKNTGFCVADFLAMHKSFSIETTVQTTKRTKLKCKDVLIWIEH